MAFLVNCNSDEKIEIPETDFYIGRGPALKITDKRISRNHAIIKKSEERKILIKAVHKNPTFLSRNGKTATLETDVWEELYDGDIISLLPDSLKFRISLLSENDTQSYEMLESCEEEKEEVEEKNFEISKRDNEEREVPTHSKVLVRNNRKRKLPDWMTELPVSENTKLKKPKGVSKPREKPQNTTKVKTLTKVVEKSPSIQQKEVKISNKQSTTSTSTSPGQNRKLDAEPIKIPSENGGSTSPTVFDDENKQIESTKSTDSAKQKNQQVFESPTDKVTKNSKNENVSPSSTVKSQQVDVSNLNSTQNIKDDVNKDQNSPVRNTNKVSHNSKIPVCPYGQTCYRKNPAHFKEYSHPSPDETNNEENEEVDDDDDFPECEYGSSCYRKNPQHLKYFKHSKSPAENTKVRKSKRNTKTKKASVLDNESDDDGESNSYDYNDSFLDNEISEESVDDDDSEDSDYVPESSADVDDVNELINEAKDFISNEKLHK